MKKRPLAYKAGLRKPFHYELIDPKEPEGIAPMIIRYKDFGPEELTAAVHLASRRLAGWSTTGRSSKKEARLATELMKQVRGYAPSEQSRILVGMIEQTSRKRFGYGSARGKEVLTGLRRVGAGRTGVVGGAFSLGKGGRFGR